MTRPDEPAPERRPPPPGWDQSGTTYGERFGPWDAEGQWAGSPPDADLHGPPKRTNRWALWGLVCAFLFAPLGLVFSAIGLTQVDRGQERGRGLAIAGLVLSLVFCAVDVVLISAGVNDALDQLAAESDAAEPADAVPTTAPAPTSPDPGPVGIPPAAPAPTTVLEACDVMMPVLIGSQDLLAAADTEAAAMQVVADMQAAVVWAEAAPDPTFQLHLQSLAADLQVIIDAVAARETPADENQQTLEDDSFVVGKDCGLAGWTE